MKIFWVKYPKHAGIFLIAGNKEGLRNLFSEDERREYNKWCDLKKQQP